ncbi:AcvB/VirJ family lysyl-phosphatidylglycerol hydrolase [Mesorhizobium sp. 1B3]|uniref:AcvB/VirJ family lysyl-phosphatidylglycerol hydrolase n=1 Tax=Mesorhizobium sp. 1B3 TaxID=3243599 RepID=UPI003D98B6D9
MRILPLALSAVAAVAVAVYMLRPMTYPETDTLAVAEVVRPDDMPRGVVFLFSDRTGYGAKDRQTARALAASGGVVVGVDLARSFAKAAGRGRDCVYFISDMEEFSQTLQRAIGTTSYVHPIVAGTGAGGTMTLALAAQSPLATIRRFVAVDPGSTLPFTRELCSGAPHAKSADGSGWSYGLQPGKLPAPIQVVETADGDDTGKAHIGSLIAQGFAIERAQGTGQPAKALEDAVATILAKAPSTVGDGLADLPLAVLPAHSAHDTMAIVLSGDGGWRDIDREIAEFLASKGVPTVGIDSLRYFWSEKSPEAIAADLSRITDYFGDAWQVRSVVLVGYSFGADVLPAAYNRLAENEKAKVSTVSLLGLSDAAAFRFDVSGWFGGGGDPSHPTMPEVSKIPPGKVQCIFGEDDDDSICPKLQGSGAEVVQLPGGHHFDDDYEAVARKIMGRIG